MKVVHKIYNVIKMVDRGPHSTVLFMCRYGFTFLGLECKEMKILNRNKDVEA